MSAPIILSQDKQDEFLGVLAEVVLDNFSLAKLIAELLIQYKTRNLPSPRATLLLDGDGPRVDIPGTNCGFVTTPVIHNAILNTRRSLEFFGLTFDKTTKQLVPIVKGRQSDDVGIEHFGLPLVKREELIRVGSLSISSPLEGILLEVWNWSNKELAHFTLAGSIVNLPSIRDVSVAMIQAYMCFVFDALKRPRPVLNPK